MSYSCSVDEYARKMCLSTVIFLQFCSPWRSTNRWWPVCLWHYNQHLHRGAKKNNSSHPVCKLARQHNCQVPAYSDSCRPFWERCCFHCTTKGKWVRFFIGELSVSWLSSHNKSPALSWGWTFRASGERWMTCRPLKCFGSSDGSATLTEKYTQQSNQ